MAMTIRSIKVSKYIKQINKRKNDKYYRKLLKRSDFFVRKILKNARIYRASLDVCI